MKKIIFFVAGIVLFFSIFFLFNIDWTVFFKVTQPVFLVFSLVLFVLAVVVSAFYVKFFLKALGEKHNFISEFIGIEFANKFFYYVLPVRVNVPIKAVLLNKICGTSRAHALSITIFEYVLDTGFMIVIGLVGISLFFQKFSSISLSKILLTLVLLLICIIVFFVIPLKKFQWIDTKLKVIRISILKRALAFVFKVIYKIRETWPKIFLNKQMVWVIPLIILNWILTMAANEMIFMSYGYFVPVLWVLTVSAVALLIGGLSQIPGGIGAREVTSVVLFTFLGIPADIAVVMAVINRVFTVVPIIIGYIYLLKTRHKFNLTF